MHTASRAGSRRAKRSPAPAGIDRRQPERIRRQPFTEVKRLLGCQPDRVDIPRHRQWRPNGQLRRWPREGAAAQPARVASPVAVSAAATHWAETPVRSVAARSPADLACQAASPAPARTERAARGDSWLRRGTGRAEAERVDEVHRSIVRIAVAVHARHDERILGRPAPRRRVVITRTEAHQFRVDVIEAAGEAEPEGSTTRLDGPCPEWAGRCICASEPVPRPAFRWSSAWYESCGRDRRRQTPR